MKHEIFTNVVNNPKCSGEPNDINMDNSIAIVKKIHNITGDGDEKQKVEAFKANIHPDHGNISPAHVTMNPSKSLPGAWNWFRNLMRVTKNS